MTRQLLAAVVLSLLIAVQCARGSEPPATVDAASMTVQELDAWLNGYYLEPSPERLPEALRAMAREGLLRKEGTAYAMMAFLAAVMRDNPKMLTRWIDDAGELDELGRMVLHQSMWMSGTPQSRRALRKAAKNAEVHEREAIEASLSTPPPDMTTLELDSPVVLDMLWASFLATGDAAYVERVLTVLEWDRSPPDDRGHRMVSLVRESAEWSIQSNIEQHPRVREICEARAADESWDGAPRLRELLDTPLILTAEIRSAEMLDVLWQGFFETGDERYVLRVLSVLEWETGPFDSPDALNLKLVHAAAEWSIRSLISQRDDIRTLCETRAADVNWSGSARLTELLLEAAAKGGGDQEEENPHKVP